jgi:hypothetical protein
LAAFQEKLEAAADRPQDFCWEEFVIAQASFVVNAVLFDELDKFSDILGDNDHVAKYTRNCDELPESSQRAPRAPFNDNDDDFWCLDYTVKMLIGS